MLSLAEVLRCHFLSLYWRCCSSCVRRLPVASWFLQLMVVLSPLSWMRGVRGAPTLVRFSVCCGSKALHSGPWSIDCSFRTVPHAVQICSPVLGSVIMCVFPHSHWNCRANLFTCVLFHGSIAIIHLYVGLRYTLVCVLGEYCGFDRLRSIWFIGVNSMDFTSIHLFCVICMLYKSCIYGKANQSLHEYCYLVGFVVF